MEHRQDRVDHAPLAPDDLRDPRPCLSGVREEVRMGEHRTLRCARRAARVLDDREVVGRGTGMRGRKRRVPDETVPVDRAFRARVECCTRFPCLGDGESKGETRHQGHRAGHVDRDERVDAEVGRELLHRRDNLAPDDRVFRAVVFELLAQLARGVERIVLDDHRAQPQHRVEGDDVLRAIRQHDGDGISRADTVGRQGGGCACDLLGELGVGRLTAEELQGRGVGIIADGRVDDVDERTALRGQVFRHPRGVARGPGSRRIEARHPASLERGCSHRPTCPQPTRNDRAPGSRGTGNRRAPHPPRSRVSATRELDSTGV